MRISPYFFLRLLAVTMLTVAPIAVQAQVERITPVIVESSAQVEQALKENKGSASTKLEGKGALLRITYVASEPLRVYMVPLQSDGRFNPNDFLVLTLAPTEGATVEIDLTVSPGWSPGEKTWLLNLLTKDEKSDAGFSAVEFVPGTITKTFIAFLRHALKAEPYSPSSYHALLGYRALGKGLTVIFGFLLILVCILAAIFTKKERKLRSVIIVIVLFQGFYGLRFGLDLLRFSVEHLSGFAQGQYDEAGSVYRIAPDIKNFAGQSKKDEAQTTVFVCRSGTNYKEKLLRYAAYPVQISADPVIATSPDYVLVMNAMKWNIETITTGKKVEEILHCEDHQWKGQKMSIYPDGSILFRILP